MNERMAAISDQIKQAFNKLKEAWNGLSRARKRLITFALIGLIVVAVGLTVILQTSSRRFVVLYEDLNRQESVRGLAVLKEADIEGQINSHGELQVREKDQNQAMGLLAMEGIPQTALDYGIFKEAGGLTTTDFEKKQYQINQLQNRMQDIIRTYDGVDNAYVTINLDQQSNRVWDPENSKNSASVKLEMVPGTTLTAGQVAGIRFLVGPSVGVAADEVTVIDSSGAVLAGSGDEFDAAGATDSQFLQRQGFEEEVEKRLYNKTANILSLPYPDADDFRISVTAVLDYDAMITESMEYSPMEDTDHGVTEHEEQRALMGSGQFSEGVIGETDNTDIPVYADLDGDGEMDAVDYYQSRDYLVNYVKQQIEKDGVKLDEASIAIMVRGTMSTETRQTLRELVSAGTNIPLENISVQGMLEAAPEAEGEGEETLFGIPLFFLYIAAGVLLALIIMMVIIFIVRGRSRKKADALDGADAEDGLAEQQRIDQEIEERKKQLKAAAIGDQPDTVITEEVRDFARSNPEITANLLRGWMREEG